MEQLIAHRFAVKELEKRDIEVAVNFVDEMLTVQEQVGFQMFMDRMDDELLSLRSALCTTLYLKKQGASCSHPLLPSSFGPSNAAARRSRSTRPLPSGVRSASMLRSTPLGEAM